VESGAGDSANFPDSAYESAGATIVSDASEIWNQADLLLKLNPPTMEEASMIREGASLISFAYPARNEDLLKALGEKKINFLGMDCVPRISRASPWTP